MLKNEQFTGKNVLRHNNGEQMRIFLQEACFIKKNGSFNLKVPLFAEKWKNKFA